MSGHGDNSERDDAWEFTMVPWWRSIVVRTVAVYILVPAILTALGISILHDAQEREVQEKFGVALRAAAASTSPYLDSDDIAAIKTNADVNSTAFTRTRAVLARARSQNNLEEDQVYVIRPAGDGSFAFVAMLQKKTFVGDIYHPPASILPAYARVMEEGKSAYTPLYTDAHGMFISGLSPIFDGRGKPVAVLQVDYGVDRYVEEVQEITRELVAIGVVVLLVLMLIGWAVHMYMRRRFEEVLGATFAIAREDYEHRVAISGNDELGTVGRALDKALQELRERFEMLKFLPRHTVQMIAERSRMGRVDLEDARRVRVVVMESDIRGFTRLSENLQPEEVIAMLNTYVRLQAELIEQFGGSIDKYMGDAVLAIFEGEEQEARALECVLAIQRAVADANERGAFGVPVRIGIGMSVGEVVMGNMGSHSRMEHTVIGSMVNLAARLCSAANAGEVVMTSEFAHNAPALGLSLPEVEEIAAKGFSEPVRCLRIAVVSDAQTEEE